jgi:methylmalonyl-CoA/ethylmalonyl-CoA epimerase
MISRIDHISLAVRDFDKAYEFFTKVLGATKASHARDKYLKYYWEILRLGDLSRIELLKPLGEGSFLTNFLKKREGVHHITLETPDIERTRKMLEEKGIPYFDYRVLGDAWKELFIHPRDAFGVLIQIAEFSPDDWLAPSDVMEKGKKWEVSKKDNKYELIFKHPGGGKVNINMDKEEISKLINDLKNLIDV